MNNSSRARHRKYIGAALLTLLALGLVVAAGPVKRRLTTAPETRIKDKPRTSTAGPSLTTPASTLGTTDHPVPLPQSGGSFDIPSSVIAGGGDSGTTGS